MLVHAKRCLTLCVCVSALIALTACAAPPQGAQFLDPYEQGNRQVHAVNKSIDSLFSGAGSKASGGSVMKPAVKVVTNFATNIDNPARIVNNVLQGRVENAAHNFFRFAVNSTLGLGGVFDPATSMGLESRDTDFGETLHVWGAQEGAYVELPLLGPATTRDAWGKVVDNLMNPLKFTLSKEQQRVVTGTKVLAKLGSRSEHADLANEILHESADSYAQTRLIYLQNRRFELDGQAGGDDYFDPFEDPYAQ